MKRIIAGIILVAGGFVWAALSSAGPSPSIIRQFSLIFLGTILFGLGVRHLWISRR